MTKALFCIKAREMRFRIGLFSHKSTFLLSSKTDTGLIFQDFLLWLPPSLFPLLKTRIKKKEKRKISFPQKLHLVVCYIFYFWSQILFTKKIIPKVQLSYKQVLLVWTCLCVRAIVNNSKILNFIVVVLHDSELWKKNKNLVISVELHCSRLLFRLLGMLPIFPQVSIWDSVFSKIHCSDIH